MHLNLGDFQECLYQVEAASSRLKRQDAASTLGSLFIENRLKALTVYADIVDECQ